MLDFLEVVCYHIRAFDFAEPSNGGFNAVKRH